MSINLVQEILRRQLPKILGLQDMSLGIYGKFTCHKDELFTIITIVPDCSRYLSPDSSRRKGEGKHYVNLGLLD